MTVQLAVALATLLVENEHLVTLYQGRYYLCAYLCTLYYGSTYGDSTFVVNQQHSLELNSLTCLCTLDVVNKQLLACLGLELLTVNLYDYVHFIYLFLTGFTGRRSTLCAYLFEPLRHKSGAKICKIALSSK